MESQIIDFIYIENDKNKCKSLIISKMNNLENTYGKYNNFQNFKKEIIDYLKQKKSVIVTIFNNDEKTMNYNINEYNEETENIDVINHNETENIDVINNEETENIDIYEHISVIPSDDEEEYDNNSISKKLDTQTYFIDSDSEDESIISKPTKMTKKILTNLTIIELKEIMREKNLKLSMNGIPLKKIDMIKSIMKHK